MALDLFLRDIYGERKIVRNGVIPEEFIYLSTGFLARPLHRTGVHNDPAVFGQL